MEAGSNWGAPGVVAGAPAAGTAGAGTAGAGVAAGGTAAAGRVAEAGMTPPAGGVFVTATVSIADFPLPLRPGLPGSLQANASVNFTRELVSASSHWKSVSGKTLPAKAVPRWMVPERNGPMPNTQASLAVDENCWIPDCQTIWPLSR
ncbi:MAG: hypothetical protein DWH82_02070 [Planctomycetota bacterium]|nr:MAG: hypothetical protein DWH82_02070 [Planctomycetota bacterium]